MSACMYVPCMHTYAQLSERAPEEIAGLLSGKLCFPLGRAVSVSKQPDDSYLKWQWRPQGQELLLRGFQAPKVGNANDAGTS